jgi:hypothetical protein
MVEAPRMLVVTIDYIIMFAWVFGEVHFLHFLSPLCQIPKSSLLFDYVSKLISIICHFHIVKHKVHIIKSTFPNGHLHIMKATSLSDQTFANALDLCC